MSDAPFSLVLAGGGARGFAHVGVLRALERRGLAPAALVGVSMGAVVAATYALREDWYAALLAMDTRAFPRPLRHPGGRPRWPWERVLPFLAYFHAGVDMFLGWGLGQHALRAGQAMLADLTRGRNLEDGRLPVAVCATDLRSGSRAVLRRGRAAQAVYASSALAGILPPLEHEGALLCDGAYADLVPIDVAREFGHPVVVAVDPGQRLETGEVRNGFQALARAVEICHLQHAHLRFAGADVVLRPAFRRLIDTLEFGGRRECVAAGARAVRAAFPRLRALLAGASTIRAAQ